MGRLFEIVTEQRPEGIVRSLVIRCGLCDATDAHIVSHKSALPFEATARVFRRRGWIVGASARKDRCPTCAAIRHHSKKEEPAVTPTAPSARLDALKTPSPSETPPRTMGREDRQIVFARLQDVYEGEATGYSKDWNDERVARDLGVPRKWVEEVREQFFGPIRADQSAEIIEITDRLSAIERTAGEAMQVLNGLDAAISGANKLLVEVKAGLAGAQKEVSSIRASIAKITGRPQ